MKVEDVQQYVGKRVLIVLKNNFKHTITLPEFEGETFSTIDKFGNKVSISCSYIEYISEVPEGGGPKNGA